MNVSDVLAQAFAVAADDSGNARARAAAYAQVAAPVPQVPAVSYSSAGQVLIVATRATADAVTALPGHSELNCTLLLIDSTQLPGSVSELHGMHTVHGRPTGLHGYLGAFNVETEQDTLAEALRLALPEGSAGFDLVLDCSAEPLIGSAVPPPGYYPVAPATLEGLDAALADIPELVGEFEKPRYFLYNAAICAHSRSGVGGCNRCLETCPTDAISGNGDVIQVNPNLCQGAGSCASACPTGAISYGYPAAADTLQYWRVLLKTFRAAGGENPVLLVYAADTRDILLQQLATQLPDRVLPVEVEELGSVGLDAWLAALAWGAAAVGLLVTPGLPPSVLREIEAQAEVADVLLQGLGYRASQVALVTPATAAAAGADATATAAAEFAALGEKRTMLRLALDHLAAAGTQVDGIALPPQAPFGRIDIDVQRCTLCMACVSQCPAKALAAGDETPQVRFVEANCVQCGICARSCPENAISLTARWLTDPAQRQQLRVLHEDQAFCCIRCGKPFATRSVIARITGKMQHHPMFSGDALERLKMCEDCRVRDIYTSEAMHE